MAVAPQTDTGTNRSSSMRRVRVGTNVMTATVLVVAIVVVAQVIAYSIPERWDMTSSGVNSLSEGTEHLLRGLEKNVRLTSLYFETDREDEDQPRYRRAAMDLLDLYGATHRSKVSAEWVNPLKDHEKFRAVLARLAEKVAFKSEIDGYRERLDRYTGELAGKLSALVQSELDGLASARGAITGSASASPLAAVEQALMRLNQALEMARENIDALSLADQPQYTYAKNELTKLYRQVSKALKDIGQYGTEQVQRETDLTDAQREFFSQAGTRYAEVVSALDEEQKKLAELKPLKFDDLVSQLQPTANPILVETDDDARVVDFTSVWPPVQEGAGVRASFAQRAFKGEEKLTSAILRVTHKEQTAVVFVRYGGSPLFAGGFMPGQPPAPYSAMKQQLEDTNFVVEEWDLKSSETPPDIDPKPTRTIYVVLKPTPPRGGPFGQQGQEPPFAANHREAVVKAIGESGRALFIAGWHPSPFGPMPATYEYGDYLNDEWGIKVDTSALLIQAVSIAPGKYMVDPRAFYYVTELDATDHDIVSGAFARDTVLPWNAPLELAAPPPEGVTLERLLVCPKRDGVWGVKDIQKYQQQLSTRDYLTKVDGDLEGPFDLAVAATKGDAKLVVVSSRSFAEDAVAFARQLAITARGFSVRSRNPGNVTLLINSLHWLNDNTEFMNIGKPIDAAVLEIRSESTVKTVQAFTIFIWPLLALAGGGVAWWIRRR